MRVVFRALGVATLLFGVAVFVSSCQKQPAGGAAAPDSAATAATYQPSPTPAPVPVNKVGQETFLADCAMCHGDGGAGDGPLAGELAARGGSQPVNLTNAERLQKLGREGVRRIVINGGAHSGRSNLMPSWGERLEPAVVDSLVDYIFQLSDQRPGVPSATVEKYLAAPAGSAANGRRWFVYYCSGCHGPEAKGDGPNAAALRKLHNIWPRNLTDSTYFATKSDQELFVLVSLGGGHAGKSDFMPAWTYTLKPEQIKDLVSYIRTVSRTASKP